MCSSIADIIEKFDFSGNLIRYERYGHGHINETYAVYFRFENEHPVRHILQKINTSVFKNPVQLMENIASVTGFLKAKVDEAGGDPLRESVTIIPTKLGASFYKDDEGNYWRAYVFVDDATSYQTAETAEVFYNSARAFGKFQRLLSDFPAHTLHETIPDFHNTKKRFADFLEAVDNDVCGRAKDVKAEIAFIVQRERDCARIVDMLSEGMIPLRVTHNDTKLNNVMIDNETGEGLCVIDLDTVMPGSALYDFGDSIRFGASTAAEDETDLSKVNFSMELFETYTKGFLSEATLSDAEISHLHWGAKIMTLECGMRFLGDYLSGDTYFRTAREKHNLDRARTQLKLVADMEDSFLAMGSFLSGFKAQM